MAGGRRVVPVKGVGSGASGRAFLYVLPCAYEDHAKLGIAGDPLVRMQAFSSRYYEFFDLDAVARQIGTGLRRKGVKR